MVKEINYIKVFFILFIIGLTILFSASLSWNIHNENQKQYEYAQIEARASYKKDLLYRRWASSHGGVYAPVTDSTPPNPYLEFIPERDITTESGKKLTLINPAYMTRQVYAITKNKDDVVKGHITSLNPLRPENKADEWETIALQRFERGETEYSSIENIGETEFLRFMSALKVEQSCMKCHAQQGYEIGEVRGGISVSVPMEQYNNIKIANIKVLSITHLLIYSIILFFTIWGFKRFYREMQKRSQIQKEVLKSEANLKIQNREYALLNEDYKIQNSQLIESREKAQESDRLKSAFLANMSHEIRTPMNGILGFADLLNAPGLNVEMQQKYTTIIQKSGDRMLNTINDIIDISKIESGQMKLFISETMVNKLLDDINSFFYPETEKKGISLDLKKGLTDEKSIINTDSDKLYASIANLIKNAIKYTDAGRIEFGYHLETTKDINMLKFFVKDSGIGIPQDKLHNIFDRFIQADIENKMARQGAGLGLAISRAYVEMLGGKIWAESETGNGSVFFIAIPYEIQNNKKFKTQEVEPVLMDKTQIAKLKVLIVEDDGTSEILITKMIKRLSEEILVAKDGIEAVEICRQNSDIDLVLMDIQLPKLNGYKATQQIREFNKDVIIIAQTAFVFTGDKEKALNAGCDAYIAKPINKKELTELIIRMFKEK